MKRQKIFELSKDYSVHILFKPTKYSRNELSLWQTIHLRLQSSKEIPVGLLDMKPKEKQVKKKEEEIVVKDLKRKKSPVKISLENKKNKINRANTDYSKS